MDIEKKIKELNLKIPNAPDPVGAYVAYKKVNNLLFISGQLPISAKNEMIKGKIDNDLKIPDGQKAAKLCALNLIAQVKKACQNDLNKVKGCIKITGYVNSSENFVNQPKVINPASEMITSIFTDGGKHTRAAVGVSSLPLGAAVEIDGIFELK